MRRLSFIIISIFIFSSLAEAKSYEYLFRDLPVYSESKTLRLVPKPIKGSNKNWFVGEYNGKATSSAPYGYDTHRGIQIVNNSNSSINLALVVEYGGVGGRSTWRKVLKAHETYSQDFKGVYRTVKKITAEMKADIPAGAAPSKININLWH